MNNNDNYSNRSASVNNLAINLATVSVKSKSVGLSMLLTMFFGPFGMLYSTIFGAVTMLLLPIIVVIWMFTSSSAFIYGIVFFVFYWLICIVWGALAANSYNNKLLKEMKEEYALSNNLFRSDLSTRHYISAPQTYNIDSSGFDVKERIITGGNTFKISTVKKNKLWIVFLFVCLLFFVVLYFAGKGNKFLDKSLEFSDFPAIAVYNGSPAKLVRDNELANTYRTRLSAALSTEPVFAGEYTQAFWGCGQECSITVFVNKRTGKVIKQTFGRLSNVELVDFRLDSGLIKAKGLLLDKGGNEIDQYATYYFLLENEQLKLIQTIPIE